MKDAIRWKGFCGGVKLALIKDADRKGQEACAAYKFVSFSNRQMEMFSLHSLMTMMKAPTLFLQR